MVQAPVGAGDGGHGQTILVQNRPPNCIAKCHQVQPGIRHSDDDRPAELTRALKIGGVTNGTIEADEWYRRRRPRLGAVMTDIHSVRESMVYLRRAWNEPELLDPVSRSLPGGL